jgi:hypothetical protein
MTPSTSSACHSSLTYSQNSSTVMGRSMLKDVAGLERFDPFPPRLARLGAAPLDNGHDPTSTAIMACGSR